MANLLNEAEIRNTWAPIIEEATGINESEKLAWMSTYCHNHKLYEDANIMSLSNNPGPMNLSGMGAVTFPGSISQGAAAGETGSGDKAPTLLPLAMQVAAQTIGLDLVPVVPMAGPMGLLSYLDFTYQGGRVDNAQAPTYVKTAKAPVDATKEVEVGTSRIDGSKIYSVGSELTANQTVLNLFTDAEAGDVELVAALEDHIPGFSGGTDVLNDAEDAVLYRKPFTRDAGEKTADKVMGLSLFSKSVAAETFQVAAAVTREQIQDLKQFGVDAVAQVESVLTNELTQSINQHILGAIRTQGTSHVTEAFGAAGDFDIELAAASVLAGGETVASEHRKVLTQILAAANLIANRGRRGAGNFAVVGAQVATVIQSIAGFVANPMANTVSQAAGAIYPLGSVAGINIYTDPTQSWGSYKIAVGRKGDGNGPGLVFMPYLMAESVQTIAEGTMAPKVAVKSRFALVEAGFHPETQYATFNIKNLAL